MSQRFNPLSRRSKGLSVSGPHEGVPDWLLRSLTDWCVERLRDSSGYLDDKKLALVELGLELFLGVGSVETRVGKLFDLVYADRERFLDVVDFLLDVLNANYEVPRQWAGELETILTMGGSAWRVARDGRHLKLERRVEEATYLSFQGVIEPGDRAAQHLRDAWNNVYGRQPNPSTAYREAIRALESIAKPVILPTDPNATLGKMIPALRAKPTKWRMALTPVGRIDSIVSLATTMELLWKSQLDRHGTDDQAVPINVGRAEAEAALHLSIALVQLFRSQAVATA